MLGIGPDSPPCSILRRTIIAVEVVSDDSVVHNCRSGRATRIKSQRDGKRFLCIGKPARHDQDMSLDQVTLRVIGVETGRDLCLFQGSLLIALVLENPC